jgi:hypothetical protein
VSTKTYPAIYTASRVRHAEKWLAMRRAGVNVTARWIDEAGEGQTGDFGVLWERILQDVTRSNSLLIYCEPDDVPLKGALVEAGMALALRVPVVAVLPGVVLEPRSMRPIGSWLSHPLVTIAKSIDEALEVCGVRVQP